MLVSTMLIDYGLNQTYQVYYISPVDNTLYPRSSLRSNFGKNVLLNKLLIYFHVCQNISNLANS